jgi:TorA maturation chaperone TorD
MDTLSNELSLLASLLDSPDVDTKEALLELAAHYPWLQPAVNELEHIPVDMWQAEHDRLFPKNEHTNVVSISVQANTNQILPLQTLKQLCKRMGIRLIASTDYLGMVLECVAHLNANPALGKVFWSELWHEHLSCWVPGFCSELKHKSRLALYRIIAERLCELFPQVQLLAAA